MAKVIFGALILVATATVFSPRVIAICSQAMMYGLLAMGTGFVHKHNGHLSFGHALWFGLSGYAIGGLVTFANFGIESAIIAGFAAICLCALLFGLIVVRSSGIAFSMLSLAVNVAVYELLNRLRGPTGGADGFTIKLPDTIFSVPVDWLQTSSNMFFVVGAVVVLIVALLQLFEGSHLGQLTLAIRENPVRASFVGNRIYLPKVLIFVMSAMISALGGAFFAIYTGFVSPESLYFFVSGQAMIMAMVGGTASALGPLAGALLFFLVRDQITFLNGHWMLPLGVTLITVMALWPSGLVGATRLISVRLSRSMRGAA